MNILIISFTHPAAQNGVAIAVHLMAEFLTKIHNVLVITKEDFIQSTIDPIYPIKIASDNTDIELIFEDEIDIIIIHSWSEFLLDQSKQYSKKHGAKIIIRPHGYGTDPGSFLRINKPPFFGFRKWLRSFFYIIKRIHMHRNDLICFLTKIDGLFKGYDIRIAKLMKHPKIYYLGNGIHSIKSSCISFKSKYNIPEGKVMFLCVANMVNRKGALKFLNHIKSNNYESKAIFVFIYNEYEYDYLKKVIEKVKSYKNVIMLSNVSRTNVIQAINECDVAFLYSCMEQQPLFLLEAMNCGKPWICPDVGSVSELKGGIILNRRSRSNIVLAINQMLNESTRNKLGDEGYQDWKTNYSYDVANTFWMELIEGIANEKNLNIC